MFINNSSKSNGVLQMLLQLPLLRFSVSSSGLFVLLIIFLFPRALNSLIYPIYRLVFGTLYPAYASYKAVRTASVKEYVSKVFIYYFLN